MCAVPRARDGDDEATHSQHLASEVELGGEIVCVEPGGIVGGFLPVIEDDQEENHVKGDRPFPSGPLLTELTHGGGENEVVK